MFLLNSILHCCSYLLHNKLLVQYFLVLLLLGYVRQELYLSYNYAHKHRYMLYSHRSYMLEQLQRLHHKYVLLLLRFHRLYKYLCECFHLLLSKYLHCVKHKVQRHNLHGHKHYYCLRQYAQDLL